ncbi:MAG: cytochrome bc complex cytochrome b subunit [Bacteroidetes bacterium]|nr:cytochrome bc complex cytochrome b subunit [Bacteroidota bacterium]
MKHRTARFLEERINLGPVRDWIRRKAVPEHKYSVWYYFGGLALFLIVVQIITGILLAFYYSPTPSKANESVRFIMEKVRYGWLIRSIHFWGANFLIAVVLVHMFSTYFMKAYRKPREVMWVLGSLILGLLLGFAFTGYLLPWTTLSYFATKIGVNTPRVLPLIGNYLSRIMMGGSDVGAATLQRMFTLHTVVLPLLALTLIILHVLLSQVFGSSVPLSQSNYDKQMRFFPDYLLRDAAVWTVGLAILLTFATVFPASLSAKVNPLQPAPAGTKPMWYFLFMYQSLRMYSRTAAIGSIALGALVWMAVPFLDRKSAKGKKSTFFTLFGLALLIYLVSMTVFADISMKIH